MFLVISGYLYGNRPDLELNKTVSWIIRRFKRIWIPFSLAALGIILVDILTNVTEPSLKDLATWFTIAPGRIPNGGHLWYISVMLFCYLITPILYFLRNRIGIFSIALFGFVLYFCAGKVIPSGFWCIEYIAGFMISSIINKHSLEEEIVMQHLSIFCFVALVLLLSLLYLGIIHYKTSSFGYISIHFILGIFIFCFPRWVFGCSEFSPLKRTAKPLLEFSDTYSYEIYLVHNFVILGSFSIFQIQSIPLAVDIILCLLWAVFGGIFLHTLAGKLTKVRIPSKSKSQ